MRPDEAQVTMSVLVAPGNIATEVMVWTGGIAPLDVIVTTTFASGTVPPVGSKLLPKGQAGVMGG
ncbi:MAG: hypothetical protein NTY34_00225, partial [Candidatus Omnitrophica bacterium]|nr:hypothetical protein [Candidatus Omnitrophota bacterium]